VNNNRKQRILEKLARQPPLTENPQLRRWAESLGIGKGSRASRADVRAFRRAARTGEKVTAVVPSK